MQPVTKDHFANVPAFLTKLWRMVCDPNTDDLICWSRGKNSFIIQNRAQFWYDLLPLYYKHNNMSSFVRQLNMYGFHKIPSTEHGPISDTDKDEIQFYHPYFQDGHPELLKLIKRKATMNPKNNEGIKYSTSKSDDLNKVLLDVKHLQGKQANVDSQLASLKQENAVLWRELAMLRQKHSKQQQIVNKLIHFLVTMVHHPSSSKMGVSVKRHYPLMLKGTSSKKLKGNKQGRIKHSQGPTIHELNEIDITPEDDLILEKDCPMVSSPLTPISDVLESDLTELLQKKDLKECKSNDLVDHSIKKVYAEEEKLSNSLIQDTNKFTEKITNHPSYHTTNGPLIELEDEDEANQESLLDVLSNGNYNINVINNNTNSNKPLPSNGQGTSLSGQTSETPNNDLALATFIKNETPKICSSGEFDSLLENNQNELEQFKDILNGCNSLDANVLLGLFNNEAPEYGLSFLTDDISNDTNNISGSELAQYGSVSFEDFFNESWTRLSSNESLESTKNGYQENVLNNLEELNTPQMIKAKPIFPKGNEK